MKCAIMKMLSCLVTESESLKIGKWQIYIYNKHLLPKVLGPLFAMSLALQVGHELMDLQCFCVCFGETKYIKAQSANLDETKKGIFCEDRSRCFDSRRL